MKSLRFLISGIWLAFATAIILSAILLSAARLLLPDIGKYRDDVERRIGDILGQPVQIGELGASWHNLGPSLELRNVTVLDASGRQPALQCASARIDINLLASLREWQFEPGLLTVRGLRLSLVRREDGSVAVIGLQDTKQGAMNDATKGAFKQWLQRQELLAIEQSELQWRDLSVGGKNLEFTNINLQLRNLDDRHRLDGSAELPQSLGQRLELAADLKGDLFTPSIWQGRVYLRGNAVHLGGWWGRQPPLGMSTVDGMVDFQAWSEWLNGIQEVEGDVHASALHFARATSPDGAVTDSDVASKVSDATATEDRVNIARVAGGFHWRRIGTGWNIDVDNFTLTRQSAASPPAQLRVRYSQDDRTGGHDIQMAYSELRAEDVAGLLLDAHLGPAALRLHLAVMAPQGDLRDGYVRYHSEPKQVPHFVVRSLLAGMVWQPDKSWPGVQGLAGKVTADEQRGVLDLATNTATVNFVNLFRTPIPVDTLAGRIVWKRDANALQVYTQEVTVQNEDIDVHFGLRLDVPQESGSPYMALTARFDGKNGEHVSRYLPAKIMGPATVAWLDKAIVNGQVTDGTAQINGQLSDFPFDAGRGLFEVRFDVTDGILDYAPGWPRLEEIESEILFHDQRFEATVAAAKSLNAEIVQAKVAIPDLTASPALLTVNGKAQGPVAAVVRYVTESPLHDDFGAYLDNVTAGGQGHLQLSLKLPLAKLPATVKGALRFNNGSLLFRDQDIDITHIDGSLSFTDHGLAADALHADLSGQAVTISAETKAGKTGKITTLSAQGEVDAAAIARRYAAPFAAYVEGSAPWRGELRIPPKGEGGMELQVVSSLQGVAVRLPSPMTKTADEMRELLVQVPLPLHSEQPIHVHYGDIVDAQLALANSESDLDAARGEIRFGGGMAALSAQDRGIRMVGTLPMFDEAQWSDVLLPITANRRSDAPPLVRQADLEIGELKLANQQLDKVQLQAKYSADVWTLDLTSAQAQGRIRLPDAMEAPVEADMKYLYLARFKRGGGESVADPRTMHPLDIKAESFHYGDLDLGVLRLRASHTPVGMRFDEVHAHSDQRDLQINGAWQATGDAQVSSIIFDYHDNDAGATLSALGYAGVIKGSKSQIDMKLKWPGSPSAFSLAQAAGSISFNIKDGQLLDVEPGAGRILGLLSFQALPRRLLLDFRDLFQKGFSFDSLTGDFTIENGNAMTDNLSMEGPSAHIVARGRVGLATEDYDQLVTVIPNISEGLPIAGAVAGGVTAGALTGGVGAGAAFYLIQKLLKPGIDKMIQVKYKVTGPWANPAVERIGVSEQNIQSGMHGKEGKNNDGH